MTFGQSISTCFRKYVDFTGTASRSEYWWWTLFVVLVGIVAAILDAVLRTQLVAILWDLAVLLPGLAVLVRRIRDAGFHWAWVFIGLVPFIGAIVLLVFALMPSKPRVGQPVGQTSYAAQ
jgi:uncharacterized membrane protein YhaH (DUF805 family)